ncbi:protein twisted gastrulation [Drosophila miranda]|uniref:Protein twisted gastrulation n=1 Tax=Drosophila pseudoobscura pseudoobscura TaxID=46245 RepID=Q29EG6_DROPS|nr:protein twisted gastrulation [Drosophila pseudoobscura]XP_017135397.1 protein twisted gastrulation [Drosophila miranda]
MKTIIYMLFAFSYIQCVFPDLAKLQRKSHTEEFEGVPPLFRAMSSSPNDGYTYNWSVVSFSTDDYDSYDLSESLVNCTVLYLDQCTSWNKCRQTCLKTGATSYRWFHDGCCECVGEYCVNYGVNESRCRMCPEPSSDDEDED